MRALHLLSLALLLALCAAPLWSQGPPPDLGLHEIPPTMPLAASMPLDQPQQDVTHAIVFIHNAGSTGQELLPFLTRLATQARREQTTILLAPTFYEEAQLAAHNAPPETPFWAKGGWITGEKSISTAQNPRQMLFSAYQVVDAMLTRLADRGMFPKLKTVAIVGHGEGGQFVQRYAAGNQAEERICRPLKIGVRYVVSCPNSLLYFNTERRMPGMTDQFTVPAQPELDNAPLFNAYPYGLERPNPYMTELGPARIIARYPLRNIVYLFGEQDTATDDTALDKTAEATLQGANRKERGQIYLNYLTNFFGGGIQQHQTAFFIKDAAYDGSKIFSSREGLWALFP